MPRDYDLFKTLFGHDKIKDMWMYTWTLNPDGPGGESRWYQCINHETAVRSAYNKEDVYFGICVAKTKGLSGQRVSANTAAYLPALWLDVDYDSKFRRKERLPGDYQDIKTAFDGLPPASFEVDSGYGLHMYWVLEEPVAMDSITSGLVRSWNGMFRERFDTLGFNLDSTSIAQVLRVPGSLNCKDRDDSKIVEVLVSDTSRRYKRSELARLCTLKANGIPEPVDLNQYNFVLDPDVEISSDKFSLWCESYRQFGMVWDGSSQYPSQSERDMAIAAMLSGVGEDDQTIVDALIQCRRELGQSEAKLRHDYYARTLARAAKSDLANRGRVAVLPMISTIKPEAPEEEHVSDQGLDSAVNSLKKRVLDLTGIEVKQLIKRKTLPVSYDLRYVVSGLPFRAIFDDITKITTQRLFLTKIMEQTNRYIPPMKKAKWEQVLASLLPITDEEAGSDIIDYRDEFAAKINEFVNISGFNKSDDPTKDCDYPCFYVDYKANYRVYCNIRDFQRWHNREGFPERVSTPVISKLANEINGRTMKIKGQQFMVFKAEKKGEFMVVKWNVQGLSSDDDEADWGD